MYSQQLENLIIDFLGYISYIKYMLNVEERKWTINNKKFKFDKFNIIYENL